MTSLIRIDFCVNDGDNGLFTGRAAAIQLPGAMAELEANNWTRPPRFADLGGKFRLAGKTWQYGQCKEYFGNWCWNAYWLGFGEASAFLFWLHQRNLYQCTCGWSEFRAVWESQEPLKDNQTAQWLREAMEIEQ